MHPLCTPCAPCDGKPVPKNGNFYVVFCDSTRQPARKKLSLSTDNRREAEALKGKFEFDDRFGRFDPWCDCPFTYDTAPKQPEPAEVKPLTLGEAFDSFIVSREATYRPSTVEHYRSCLAPLVFHIGSESPVTDFTAVRVGDSAPFRAVLRASRRTSSGWAFSHASWWPMVCSREIRRRRYRSRSGWPRCVHDSTFSRFGVSGNSRAVHLAHPNYFL